MPEHSDTMKSIVYLTDRGERRNIPRFVEHDPRFPAFEIYQRSARWLSNAEAHLRYCICIESGMRPHEKINRRAEYIARTSNAGRSSEPDIYTTAFRTAKARYRNARRSRRPCHGYACIDIAFGLIANGDCFNFTPTERRHIQARLELAATSRAPLPPWRLCACWPPVAA